MKKLLLWDNSPFLLTLLFGSLAWLIVHTIEEYKDKPLIDWSYTSAYSAKEHQTIYHWEVRNITQNHKFDSLALFFSYQNDSGLAFIDGSADAMAPAVYSIEEPVKPNAGDFTVPVYAFQPGSIIVVDFATQGNLPVGFRCSSGEVIKVIPHETIESFVFRNQIRILVWLIGIWAALLLLYFIVINKQSSNEKPRKYY